LAAVVVVAGVAAQWKEAVRSKGEKTRFGQASGYILYIGIQPSVFVYD
jgi:hypothetical protein